MPSSCQCFDPWDVKRLSLFNQHLSLQCHVAIFIPACDGKADWLGHLPPQICSESHSNANLCPEFSLTAYLQCIEPLRKKLDGSHITSLVLSNNRQDKPVCAKTISSWVRNVLCIARAQVSGFSPRYCSICSLYRWCFPGVYSAGSWLG